MKKSVGFKQQRKAKLDEAQLILEAATAEKRDLTPEERVTLKGIEDEVEVLERSADEALTQENLELRLARDKYREEGSPDPEKKELGKYNLLRHLNVGLSNKSLDGFESEMQQEAVKEFRANSSITVNTDAVLIPEIQLRSMFGHRAKRDMTVTGGSPAGVEGGYAVETEVNGYIEALREENKLISLGVDMMTGLVGNIDMTRENAVATLAWEGETDEAAETSPTYKQIQFKPNRLSGFIDISRQLILQNSQSIQQRVANQLLSGISQALDAAGFAGPGTGNAPTGIINDGDVGTFAIGTNGGALTRAGILEMEEILGDAFGALDPKFITTNPNRKKLKSAAIDGGSGLFLWDRLTNEVESYMAHATSHLPKNLTKGSGSALSAAILGTINAQSAAFGQWGGIEILNNPYTKAKSGQVELVINAFLDFHVLQPGAFVVCKDIVTT